MATAPITHVPQDGAMGIDYTRADTAEEFALGTVSVSDKGGKFIYAHAAEAITGKGYICSIDDDFEVLMVDTTSVAGLRGLPCGGAQAALADNEYGWFQIEGIGDVRGAASCAANAELNVTATGGVLDDDATVGAEVIAGIHLQDAIGGSEATGVGYYRLPRVDRTL